MIRTLNIVLLATSIAGLIGVYALKFSVEDTAAEKRALERKISLQEGDLSLLKADWAYLNQPAHVGPIVARHVETLGLVAASQKQFGGFDGLPMRLPAPDAHALDDLFESLEAGVDPAADTIEE